MAQAREPFYPPPAPAPPKTWRETFLHSLPHHPGPYHVGYVEVEMPAREPRAFSHIKRNHEHALRMDTMLFSIYYPCELGPDGGMGLKRVPWLPRPRIETCHGYAKFLSIPNLPVTAYIAATSMFTKLPAFRNARLAEHWAPRNCASTWQKLGEAEERRPDPQSMQDGDRPSFPVIIFSHGLGGSRTMHSSVCGGLASFGVVVIAVEHRDGSGARTYVNMPPGKKSHRNLDSQELDRNPDHSAEEDEDETHSNKDPKENGKSWYKVDYLFPKDNAQDTAPHNPRGVDTELREAQIEMRLAEIEEAYHVLSLINGGRGEQIRENNLRKKGRIGSSSQGLDGINWSDWRGRLHMDNVTISGHSFGGATSVQVLRLADRFPWIGQGVLLDAWGPATPENTEQRIEKPLLSIGSEAFMHWQENFDRVEGICREARDQGAPTWQMTIRGSTHLSQTDFAILYPNWMSMLMKTIVNPRRALYLTITAALEFLGATLPVQQRSRFETAWPTEHLLEKTDSETTISSDHRPEDKYIAARLKIENELRIRLASWIRRNRPWRKSMPKGVPRDSSGRPLIGLIDLESEVWMHMRPATFLEDTGSDSVTLSDCT